MQTPTAPRSFGYFAKKKKYTAYIGIDCGVNTGIAVWVPSSTPKMNHISTGKIHHAMFRVSWWHQNHPGKVFVRVEDAREREFFTKEKNHNEYRGKLMGAGSVKRDSKIWDDFLKDLGVEYEMVAPKNNRTKVTADYFKKISGYTGKTSEHARDAGMLVIGY